MQQHENSIAAHRDIKARGQDKSDCDRIIVALLSLNFFHEEEGGTAYLPMSATSSQIANSTGLSYMAVVRRISELKGGTEKYPNVYAIELDGIKGRAPGGGKCGVFQLTSEGEKRAKELEASLFKVDKV